MTRHHTRRLTSPAVTTVDAVVALAGGNAGAIQVLVGLAQANPITLLALDDLGIYGADIWLAYKDVCGQDMGALTDAILDNSILDRLNKLGYVS